MDDLTNALVETGATIAFDAIGGGKLAGQILTCMEIAINKTAKEYSRYGSNVHKQVYIYGSLDTRAVELNRAFGMAWGVGGWLLFPFLQKIGRADAEKLRQRVVAELKTTFASHYTQGRLAAGSAAACQHRDLQQALHRREIPDQSEQGRLKFAASNAFYSPPLYSTQVLDGAVRGRLAFHPQRGDIRAEKSRAKNLKLRVGEIRHD